MNKVVHFEIPFNVEPRAKKFYTEVFGWTLNPVPEMEYTIAQTTEMDKNNMPKTPGSINGGMMKRSKNIISPVITIEVPNIEEHLKKVKDAGGEVVKGSQKVGDMGFSAYIKDTEGNIIGLWQTARISASSLLVDPTLSISHCVNCLNLLLEVGSSRKTSPI